MVHLSSRVAHAALLAFAVAYRRQLNGQCDIMCMTSRQQRHHEASAVLLCGSAPNDNRIMVRQAGTTDAVFLELFKPVMARVMETYQPGAVVLQCGARVRWFSFITMDGYDFCRSVAHLDCAALAGIHVATWLQGLEPTVDQILIRTYLTPSDTCAQARTRCSPTGWAASTCPSRATRRRCAS